MASSSDGHVESGLSGITLLFPKRFELFKFLCKLQDFRVDIVGRPEVGFVLSNGRIVCKFMCPNQSDIGFLTYLIKDKVLGAVGHVILVGSCGSPDERDFCKTFVIGKAFKGDRGCLRGSTFVPKDTNLENGLSFSPNTALKGFDGNKNIMSLAFLNSHPILDYPVDHLYDMETFEFLLACQNKGLLKYSVIRFVTDILPREHLDRKRHIEVLRANIDKIWSGTQSETYKKVFYSMLRKGSHIEDIKKFIRLTMKVGLDGLIDLLMGSVDRVTNGYLDENKVIGRLREEYNKKICNIKGCPADFTTPEKPNRGVRPSRIPTLEPRVSKVE